MPPNMLSKRFDWYWRITRHCFFAWAVAIAISPFTILCMHDNLATYACARASASLGLSVAA